MSQSVYLNADRARQALDLAMPTILHMMQTVTNKKALHLVILGHNGEVLHEADVGPDVAADTERLRQCTDVARGKARIHFRTGRPSLEIQARRPNALVVGDTIWGGSAEHEGVIVAASGVQSSFDEAISAIVAAILWALCVEAQIAHLASPNKKPIYQGPA